MEISMRDLNNMLRSAMQDDLKSINWDQLHIDKPKNLPLEVDIKLGRYNEALKRLDLEKAEQTADELLEWLGRYGQMAV